MEGASADESGGRIPLVESEGSKVAMAFEDIQALGMRFCSN